MTNEEAIELLIEEIPVIGDVEIDFASGITQARMPCDADGCVFDDPTVGVQEAFVSVPGYTGDMATLETDVIYLEGNHRADVPETQQGQAALRGTFRLRFRGATTSDIPFDASLPSALLTPPPPPLISLKPR